MKRPLRSALLALWLLASAAFAPAVGQDQPLPLHERIDQLIDAAAVGPIAPPASDADFVRRLYLDLTGVVPTSAEARAFLADQAPDKRIKLVDTLLASPAFNRHMTLTLDVMLMERRADKTALLKPWLTYLMSSVSANKPLDQLYREMLSADGADAALRPAARFTLNRDAEPNLMTRDIGRLAFGMDLQCAQCHDHPLIDDYYQADYYGLLAFVQRTSLFNDAKNKQMLVGEKADGEANYKSVFTGAAAEGVRPQLLKGAVLYVEPTFAKGEEYVSAPAKDVRAVPKFSRRSALAGMIAESSEFRRNLANRLWALMFGRGIVHPVDFHHAANPPAHPELLTLLASELKSGGFNLRSMLRELALTRAYQRSCDAPRPESVNFAEIAERLTKLEATKAERITAIEPLTAALAQATAARQALAEQNTHILAEIALLETTEKTAAAASDKALAEHKAAADALAKKQEQATLIANAAARTNVAVKKIPDDQAVAQAFALLDQRSMALTAEIAAATTAAADLAVKSAPLVEQTKLAHEAVAAARGKLPTDQSTTLDQAVFEASHQVADARYIVASLDGQIATAKALVEYSELAKADAAMAEAAWNALVERWTVANQLGALKPLSPEQLATSAMRVTGFLGPLEEKAISSVDKEPSEAMKNAADADKPRVRLEEIEIRLIDQVDKTFAEFAKLYGGESGQDFQATANQSLYFGNGATIESWLKAGGESLAVRLGKLEDPAALADELYISVFSRPATDVEKQDVADFVKDRSADKPVAIGEMIWALLSSSEFRFNH